VQRLIVVGIVGFFAQCVDGALGMGYGAFSASFLIAGGILPAMASAAVHTAEIFTTFLSGSFHLRFGNVRKEWLLPLAGPGVVGGALGAYFLASLPGDTMRPYVAGLLLVLGIIMLYRFFPRRAMAIVSEARPPDPGRWRGFAGSQAKLPVLGLFSGFVDAIGGGGWGPIATPGLILTENSEPRTAVGTVNLAEFFVTVSISATFFGTMGWEAFRWDLVVALLIGGAIAAPLGAYLCKRLPPRALGVLVGLALVGFNTRTLALSIAG
jgi:uncharacterized membrane protein YfcA